MADRTHRVGYVGFNPRVPEYIYHHPEFSLAYIATEPEAIADPLLTFSMVRSVPIRTVASMRELETVVEEDPVDLCIMCGFRLKLSRKLLSKTPVFNLHPSSLPAYKGPAPTFWATLENETTIGLTCHRVNEEFDAGAIVAQRTVPYYLWMNERDLHNALSQQIPAILTTLAAHLESGATTPNAPGGYVGKRPADADCLSLDDAPDVLYNKVRANNRPPFLNGARLTVGSRTFVVKALSFTPILSKDQGEVFEDRWGHTCVAYRPGVGLRLLDFIEMQS